MSISINTDVMSNFAQRSLATSNQSLFTASNRLSTGLKINSASDGAANLALSSSISAKQSGMSVANNNIQTGLTQLQTFEGYLGNITETLQKTRDIAIQAANGVYADSERAIIDKNGQDLLKEVELAKVLANEEVNVNDTRKSLTIQIGELGDSSSAYTAEDLFLESGLSFDMTTISGARDAIAVIDAEIAKITDKRASLGANMTNLEEMVNINSVRNGGLMEANSLLLDTDMAEEASRMMSSQIRNQSATSVLQQIKGLRSDAILSLY